MKDMQKMNTLKGLLGITVGAALLSAACGSSESNNNPPPGPSATGPVPSATGPLPSVGPTGSVAPTPVGPTGAPLPTTVPTGPTGGPPPGPTLSDCTNLIYARDNELLGTSGFPGVRVVYGYGDDKTTLCSGPATAPGKLCVVGNATSSKSETSEYQYYGAGVGLQLAAATDGVADAPWNAAALGIVGVKFTVSDVQGRNVRVQAAQADEGDLEYQENNFLAGGSKYASFEIKKGDAKEVSLALTDFKLPAWSAETLGLETDAVLDAAKIYAVSFQIPNNPADKDELYSFCISDLQWVDEAGAPVPVEVVDTPVGDGGVDVPDDTSGDTSGDVDTSGDIGTEEPQLDTYAILQQKCAGSSCHGEGNGGARPQFAHSDAATAKAAADGKKAEINTRVGSGAMPPASTPNPALTDEERAAILAWATAP